MRGFRSDDQRKAMFANMSRFSTFPSDNVLSTPPKYVYTEGYDNSMDKHFSNISKEEADERANIYRKLAATYRKAENRTHDMGLKAKLDIEGKIFEKKAADLQAGGYQDPWVGEDERQDEERRKRGDIVYVSPPDSEEEFRKYEAEQRKKFDKRFSVDIQKELASKLGISVGEVRRILRDANERTLEEFLKEDPENLAFIVNATIEREERELERLQKDIKDLEKLKHKTDKAEFAEAPKKSMQAVFGVALDSDEITVDTRGASKVSKEKETSSKDVQVHFGKEYKEGRKAKFSLEEYGSVDYNKFLKLRKDLDEGKAAGVISNEDYLSSMKELISKADDNTKERLTAGGMI